MNNGNFFPSSNFNNLDTNNIYEDNQNKWFGPNDIQEQYLDTILKLNTGKKTKVYITIPGSKDNQDKVFEGIIERIGKDHIIISNPTTGEYNIVLLPYITYITFEEKVNY